MVVKQTDPHHRPAPVEKADTGLNIVAIIPARGGSKGIPHKNIKPFAGFPLIAYSIAAAQQSKYVNRIIVSTDDPEIAAVARDWGAETPFLRPAEISGDTTLDLPVFQHAVRWLAENENYHCDIVVQLRPTSPFRTPGLVDEAIQLLLDHPEADSVRGVVPSGENPFKMWRIDPEQGTMSGLLSVPGIDEPYNAPRQQLPKTYWQTGHIDAIRPERTFMAGDSMSGQVILPLLLDPKIKVDIDVPADWLRYEAVLRSGELDIVLPGPAPEKSCRRFPDDVQLLATDFDGVMTDDRVWVDETGHEAVFCSRSDGMGIRLVKEKGVRVVVISSETNPVVAARCQKLGVDFVQGTFKKAEKLTKYMSDYSIDAANAIYIGNDVNDLSCFPLVACALTPHDAHPTARDAADIVLTKCGGYGAVREVCDRILELKG